MHMGVAASCCWQEDNDPEHTARGPKECFESKHIHLLEWSSQSPEVNIIENMLQDLKMSRGLLHTDLV